MKKIIAVVLAVFLFAGVFCFAGCNNAGIESRLDAIEAELNDAKLRIQLLEGVTETDTSKTYNMGDEFTFKNNGIELFKIQLIEYRSVESSYILDFKAKTINMPDNIRFDRFFNAYAYNVITNEYFYWSGGASDFYLESEYKLQNMRFYNIPSYNQVTHFVIGLAANSGSIVPYAVFLNN